MSPNGTPAPVYPLKGWCDVVTLSVRCMFVVLFFWLAVHAPSTGSKALLSCPGLVVLMVLAFPVLSAFVVFCFVSGLAAGPLLPSSHPVPSEHVQMAQRDIRANGACHEAG